MSAKWASGFTRWAPYHDPNGETYSLTHLHPHRFTLEFQARNDYPARNVEIRIGYSSHPFTRECAEGETPHNLYSKTHDLRTFAPERYQWSLQLPEIMKRIDSRRCHATNHKNYFIVDNVPGLPASMEYWIFFNTRKDGPDALRVFVESAYAGDTGRAPHGRGRETILFRALVTKTLGLKKANPAK